MADPKKYNLQDNAILGMVTTLLYNVYRPTTSKHATQHPEAVIDFCLNVKLVSPNCYRQVS